MAVNKKNKVHALIRPEVLKDKKYEGVTVRDAVNQGLIEIVITTGTVSLGKGKPNTPYTLEVTANKETCNLYHTGSLHLVTNPQVVVDGFTPTKIACQGGQSGSVYFDMRMPDDPGRYVWYFMSYKGAEIPVVHVGPEVEVET